MKSTESDTPDCCPPFDPKPWDEQVFEWENKTFIRDRVFTLYYMPVNFGSAMKRLFRKITAAEATVPDWLCLSDHTSPWNMDLYLAVDRDVPGSESKTLNGKFFSKVYEGPFKDTKKWCSDFEETVKTKGLNVKKWYMWYTTCPKCARKYGKNYVVIVGQVN